MSDLLKRVAGYYSDKLAKHGTTPKGVDWNGEESQQLRFAQLTRIIEPGSPFSLNDLGCGYGALLAFLDGQRITGCSYRGWDVSTEMVEAARQQYRGRPDAKFFVGAEPDVAADYSVASGIFGVRLQHTESEWTEYVMATLRMLDRTSTVGFAFNCLTSYSDEDRKRPDLYYADPCALFDFCKRNFSRHVALLHDYGLYEFTIMVRK